MSVTQTWLFRTSLILGTVVAVVTIIYYTPMPEHHFKSCDRPCHELDWPMICRVKMTLEEYHSMSRSCGDCPHNITHCTNKNCVTGDGTHRSIFTANRQIPGPTINVCQNDILLVDVSNAVPGQEFAIHWRGQPQLATQVMDGVPMITQCPISSFTTFQYKFRAQAPGTHYWHVHSGSRAADGVFGALIVKQPDVIEPQKRLYDVDDNRHVLVLSEMEKTADWHTSKDEPSSFTLLVNGRGIHERQKFRVKYGLRYRFRLIHAAGKKSCPVDVSIDNHVLKIIALDGHPVNPYEASSILLGKGERVDFVVKANQPRRVYAMNFRSECNVNVSSWLFYESGEMFSTDEDRWTASSGSRVFQTNVCDSELGKICLGDVQSLFVMPAALRTERVDKKIYFVFDHQKFGAKGLENAAIQSSSRTSSQVYCTNNLTFTFPSSPLLTQYDDVRSGVLCDKGGFTDAATRGKCGVQSMCRCLHIEQIPLDYSTEIVLVDHGGDKENIFHLHGYSFYVVGSRTFPEPMSLDIVKELDENGQLFKRNLLSPARKDTIRLPRYGVIAIRFIANNPGFWMLRDELAPHWTRGLDVILQVGTRRDLHAPPSDFPRCGNWVGPEFFLA